MGFGFIGAAMENTIYVDQLYQLANLGYCWTCSLDDALEEHHIVPVCYGGATGPIVTLCSMCHTNIHTLSQAKCVKLGKPSVLVAKSFSTRWDVSKAFFLANTINKARLLVSGDPNKTSKFNMTFKGDTSRKVKDLKRVLKVKNQSDVIKAAIDYLHSKYFI